MTARPSKDELKAAVRALRAHSACNVLLAELKFRQAEYQLHLMEASDADLFRRLQGRVFELRDVLKTIEE